MVEEHWNIETLNPTCVVYSARAEGFGVSRYSGNSERNDPGHTCIVQVCFTEDA